MQTRCRVPLRVVCVELAASDPSVFVFLLHLASRLPRPGRTYLDRLAGRHPTLAQFVLDKGLNYPCCSPHPSCLLQLPVKCDTAAFFDYSPPTPGSIDEKQTASELLCPLCLSTLLASPHCVTETTPVAAFHTLHRVPFGIALSHCSLNLPACISNRQPTSPQNLSLAAFCHGCPAPQLSGTRPIAVTGMYLSVCRLVPLRILRQGPLVCHRCHSSLLFCTQ